MFDVGGKSDARNALGVSATWNSIFGLCPLDKVDIFLGIRWWIATLSLSAQLLLAIYETSLSCDHTKNGVDNLLVITYAFLGLSKMIFYYWNRDKLRLNVESAIEDWSSEDSKDFGTIMYSCRTNYNKIALIMTAASLSTVIAFPLKIFIFDSDLIMEGTSIENDNEIMTLVPGKRFLFPATCSLNDISPFSHWALVIAQFVQFVICIGVNMMCDLFILSVAEHLCGQYTILGRKFAKFEKLDNERETRKQFRDLVARHEKLLKLSKILEGSVNIVVLTQMINNLLVIIVAGFNFLLLLKKREVLGAFSNIVVVQFGLVHTYMYSHIGDKLSNHGRDISLSVYDSQWHTLPKDLTKDIVLVMTRANFSFHLTAGKFFKMTRGTFTDIVKTSFSYLSVLYAIINDKKF